MDCHDGLFDRVRAIALEASIAGDSNSTASLYKAWTHSKARDLLIPPNPHMPRIVTRLACTRGEALISNLAKSASHSLLVIRLIQNCCHRATAGYKHRCFEYFQAHFASDLNSLM
jgi:hypothetical protein